MRRMASVLLVAAVMAAMIAATAVPGLAYPGEFGFSLAVSEEQTGGVGSGSLELTISDGCVDFFGAIDAPGHASDTSDDFQGPVCLF